MAIPDYQTLMLPLLERVAAASAPVMTRTFLEPIANQFNLTDEERAQRLPSGIDNLLYNRLAWARTYLVKAGLLEAPKRGMVAVTEEGRKLLSTGPTLIDLATLRRYPAFVAWASGGSSKTLGELEMEPRTPEFITSAGSANGTPLERIEQAKQELDRALRSDLIARVRAMSPSDFEELIIRLLRAMGYGLGLAEFGRVVGGAGDGGIDGVIHQDPLGLDRVYVQAKRYKEGNSVGPHDIRDFVGALNIHRATKGVFVTASHFTQEAANAASNSTVKVILLDGERLASLMVQYTVGVVVHDRIEIKEMDEGFFDG